MSIKIVVATHKKYNMPNDQMYLPLQVGAEISKDDFGYQKDNDGENISKLNPYFCELTGLYWAWKNLESDYIGLVHYRRHFRSKIRSKNKFEEILHYDDIKQYLGNKCIFLPQKRKYYIESLYSHYAHTHEKRHLDITRDIIKEYFPDYLSNFDTVLKHTSGYMFNMFIMKKDLLNEYCIWLFDILFKLYNEIDISKETDFNKRFPGRISEILLNVWICYQLAEKRIKNEDIIEFKMMHLENINWIKKGNAFLKAKFFNKKYEKGF